MDSIIAVPVTLDSGVDRYFLTWGDLGSNRPWPGDIERAVLRASARWAMSDFVAFRLGQRDAFTSADPSLQAALAHLGLRAPARPPLRDAILLPDQAQPPGASISTGTGLLSSPPDQVPEPELSRDAA